MSVLASIPTERLKRLERLRLTASAPFRARTHGEWASKGVGGTMEFVDRRPYSPGDDLRRIDWRAAARSDRVQVKRRRAESALAARLLIDNSPSMARGAAGGDPSPFEAAKLLAYAFAFIALRGGNAVSIAPLWSDSAPLFARGRAGLPRVEQYCARMEPAGDSAHRARGFAGLMRGRTSGADVFGTTVLFSDMLFENAPLLDGLRALSGRGSAVHLVSREVESPDPPEESAVMDVETGRMVFAAWDADRRRAYSERFALFLGRAQESCRLRRVRYARIRAEAPLDEAALRELRAAGMVMDAP